MSESLLHSDILAWLSDHRGRERARPRAELLAHLKSLGHTIADREMRRVYAEEIPQGGSGGRGYFLIVTAEDRKESERGLHHRAMSELVREKRIKDAAPAGQMELYEEA